MIIQRIHINPKSIYLIGPMSGLPERNFPAFHEAAERLRAAGYQVFNPAEINPDAIDRGDAGRHEYLRRDIVHLVQCQKAALINGNYENSSGAQLEIAICDAIGTQIKSVEEWLKVAP